MRIKGFQGTSLLDYPGRISSLLFFGGCNLTCPFCHNPGLVLEPEQYPDYPPEHILKELEARRPFIDAAVISGGEPTLEPGLEGLLRDIKGLGLAVKLDTNGLLPEVLDNLLRQDLLDFVALDVKTSPARYSELHTDPVNGCLLEQSIRLLLESAVEHEFRTTCVPGLVEEPDIDAIGAVLAGGRSWVLQQYVPGHALAGAFRALEPHPPETLRRFARLAAGYAAQVSLRGV